MANQLSPKVFGTIINKNEGVKAWNTMRYHLDVLGFDKVIFIDNGSTDGSIDYINEKKDDRITIIYDYIHAGLIQGEIKTNITKNAFKDGANIVVPFDCDMMWQIDIEKLKEHYLSYKSIMLGLLCKNYFFYLYEWCKDSDFIKTEYWRHLFHYCEEPNCTKYILFDTTTEFSIFEGDHFIISKYTVFPTEQFKIFEYPYSSYEDFVRKTMNNAIGHIIRLDNVQGGAEKWINGTDLIGGHTSKFLRSLYQVGHLYEEWKDFVITEKEIQLMMKNNKRVLFNDTMRTVQLKD